MGVKTSAGSFTLARSKAAFAEKCFLPLHNGKSKNMAIIYACSAPV